jgi:hypothetical protein
MDKLVINLMDFTKKSNSDMNWIIHMKLLVVF